MTTKEFSEQFDILYNNIGSNAAPGLDEYEKSVFLTKAQYELIKNNFNPQGNKYKEGFDGSPKRQMDFSTLVAFSSPAKVQSTQGNPHPKFDDRSQLYILPQDFLFILNESATVTVDNVSRNINIIPITYMDYSRMMEKPYKQPLKNQGWRLLEQDSTGLYVTEIIVKEGLDITNYKIRYVKKPLPIILTDLESLDVSIDGVQRVTECNLDPSIHPEILQRAVELAKAAYMGDANSVIQLGERSE